MRDTSDVVLYFSSGKLHLHSGVSTLKKEYYKWKQKESAGFQDNLYLLCLCVDYQSAWKLHSCEQSQPFLNSDIPLLSSSNFPQAYTSKYSNGTLLMQFSLSVTNFLSSLMAKYTCKHVYKRLPVAFFV